MHPNLRQDHSWVSEHKGWKPNVHTWACVCQEECCWSSFLCISLYVFRQVPSPAGLVTEWVHTTQQKQHRSTCRSRRSTALLTHFSNGSNTIAFVQISNAIVLLICNSDYKVQNIPKPAETSRSVFRILHQLHEQTTKTLKAWTIICSTYIFNDAHLFLRACIGI